VTINRDTDLETQIAEWRAHLHRRRVLDRTDAEELEDHLRSQIVELTEAGLHDDEAFLVALMRMGSLDELSREFTREHSDRLWKQLTVTGGDDGPTSARSRTDLGVMIGCAVAAAVAIKVPALFGRDLEGDAFFYGRNLSLFALPPLAAYFAWRRRTPISVVGLLALLFTFGAVAANAYPLAADDDTALLTALHLPIALWLVVGVAYMGGDWRSDRKRMDFIRFTGEWFIYLNLLSFGGGVLIGLTAGAFQAIGLDTGAVISKWLVPCGAMAAVVVAAWLVEAKQSVIENMAPVLTRVFTPLFVATLLAFLGAAIWTNKWIDIEREPLIIFDFLLVVVLGLLLYTISARDPAARPGIFDRLQLTLIVSALLIDILVLLAITSRITEWGFSPNKSAALGENLILLTNLAWSVWLILGLIRGTVPFARLERWQTNYIVVYAVWAWTVVFAFPPLFGFA
jgi:hypothetical protein